MKAPNRFLYSAFWTALCTLIFLSLFWVGHSTFQTRSLKLGSPAELYSTETNNDLQGTFSQAIYDAEKSVLLMVYTLKDKRIIQALRNKADQGIDVRVICDGNASRGVEKQLGKKIKLFLRKGKGLMHQKILSIDGHKVWIGSANMTTASLKMHGNLVMGFDSPKMAELIKNKFEGMTAEGFINPVPSAEISVAGQKVELWFFPDNDDGVEKVKKLIRSAKKSIKVAMFTWTRNDFAQEIAEANHRGVKTEIVVDRNASASTNASIINQLFESSIPVRLSQGNGLLHHKFMIIDDTILINGSTNWTFSAFRKNDECFVVLHDLTTDQIYFLNYLWKRIILDSAPFLPNH
jgi:phosphatidylserine/phosphatidylglycerophosphate/cardiolipin synthase-like enzyme